MVDERKDIILSIVIVNWNSGSVLADCLKSIYAAVKVPSEIIVVDNNSSDGSVEMIKGGFPKVALLVEKENLGYSRGNNLGVKHARGDYVLILNPDTILLNGAVDKMLDFLKAHKDAGMAGPRILRPDGSIASNCKRKLPTLSWDFYAIFLFQKIQDFITAKLTKFRFFKDAVAAYYEKTEECECLQGCCIMFRRGLFELLGGFDESVPMYLDDIDLFYRVRKSGYRNYYVSDAVIVHLEQHSTKTTESYKLYDVLGLEAQLFYYRKHFGRLSALIFRAIVLSSVPYLLALDVLSIPYFLVRGKMRERKWVFIKHMKYLELAVTGRARGVIKEKS